MFLKTAIFPRASCQAERDRVHMLAFSAEQSHAVMNVDEQGGESSVLEDDAVGDEAALSARTHRRTNVVLAAAIVLALAASAICWRLSSPSRGTRGSDPTDFEVVTANFDAMPAARDLQKITKACLGKISVLDGVGGTIPVHLISAGMNTPKDHTGHMEVWPFLKTIVPHMKSRAYFGTACNSGEYDPNEYLSLRLLGKSVRFTVNLRGAECGSNVAVYLLSLPRNTRVGKCGDYYCDAAHVCGTSCAEIDIMEANMHAFVSTIHTPTDRQGLGGGFSAAHRTWEEGHYGPWGLCIDTTRPFVVEAIFHVSTVTARLEEIEIKLTQSEKWNCPKPLTIRLGADYGPEALFLLSKELEKGMTPTLSYWGSGEKLGWFDGSSGSGNATPCAEPGMYQDSVRISNFSVSPAVEHDNLSPLNFRRK